ncbi:MAG: prephenate dehydrogenase/arogenate dehydrogenase family protein [Chloroflexi bacterium]|nr:prephenate dehydrogenase/arogenate dehydrogenase family protein [Chloroflexota bacterium]
MKITIIGLGLIGGSLGLAIRRSDIAEEVIGHNRSYSAARRAQQRGAIDRAEHNLPAAVEQADLVIVATPAGTVKSIFSQIAPYLPPHCVVSDVASTKKQVVDWAGELLPEHNFVGGHPMAGKEKSGIEEADANLFTGCTYCITPSPKAAPEAIELVAALVTAIGAKPFFVDPSEHDSYVAAVSHVPFIASTGLFWTAGGSQSWRDMRKLAATGFRGTTRLASGDVVMHRDICHTNRENILHWLDAYITELTGMRELIAAGDDRLEEAFRKAKEARDAWLEQGDDADADAGSVVIPSTGEQIRQMLFGNRKQGR